MIQVDEGTEKKTRFSKHRNLIIIFGFFIVILAVILYTSFAGNVTLVGSAVDEGETITSISIIAELDSVPNISIGGEFDQVILKGNSESFLYVGNQKFSLDSETNIRINDFNGDITFGEKTISKLKGKASRVSVDSVPVFPKSGETLKISFDENFDYSLLDIDNGVEIKKLEYATSGKILLGSKKTTVNLEKDNLLIKKFYGDLEIRNSNLQLRGFVDYLGVNGDQKISVSI